MRAWAHQDSNLEPTDYESADLNNFADESHRFGKVGIKYVISIMH